MTIPGWAENVFPFNRNVILQSPQASFVLGDTDTILQSQHESYIQF